MFHLPIILLSSLTPLTDADLSLEIRLAKQTVMTGEATKIVLTWKPKRAIKVVFDTEALWLDAGAGYERYSEARFGEPVQVTAPTSLRPGDAPRTEYRIGVDEVPDPAKWPSMHFAFRAPGRYKAKLTYDAVSSNELTIDVTAPSGRNAELFDRQLRQKPELLTLLVNADDNLATLADQLVIEYPTASHLAPTVLLRSEKRFLDAAAADIEAGRNPWEGDALRVFEELRSRDLSSTAFGEDHLLLIAQLSERLFDLDRRREAYEAVIERYPNGVAAVRAKEWLDENVSDRTAPILNVTAAPTSLWPPNHKLVPITVTVQVSDDRDASSAVKLVSITCDDACDVASDVSGAALGTDDRQFDVRSERKGTSAAGRTYTITYSAEDAAGNKSTAETKVTIAHDQGKKK